MPDKGDIKVSDISGNRQKYNGKEWKPLCNILTCNNFRSVKGYCISHSKSEEIIKKEKSINRKIPSEEIKNYYISLVKKPDKVNIIPKNPKKGDYIIKKTGRLHIYNGKRWVSCCVINDCKKQITISIFCTKHYNKLIKNSIKVNDNEKQCSSCNNIFNLDVFKDDNTFYKQCNKCRELGKNNSIICHNKRRLIYIQLKIDLGGRCIKCNITDLEILEFDHIDPKTKISRVYDCSSISKMKEEAYKCQLLCRRCHQMRSEDQHKERRKSKEEQSQSYGAIYQRNHYIKVRKYISDVKIKIGSCQLCGWFDKNYLSCLDFDHINPDNKYKNICELVRYQARIKTIQEEIKKCRLICKNCHLKHTNRQQGFVIVKLYEEMNTINCQTLANLRN